MHEPKNTVSGYPKLLDNSGQIQQTVLAKNYSRREGEREGGGILERLTVIILMFLTETFGLYRTLSSEVYLDSIFKKRRTPQNKTRYVMLSKTKCFICSEIKIIWFFLIWQEKK